MHLKSDMVMEACQPMAAPVVLESVLCATLRWTNMLRSQLEVEWTMLVLVLIQMIILILL